MYACMDAGRSDKLRLVPVAEAIKPDPAVSSLLKAQCCAVVNLPPLPGQAWEFFLDFLASAFDSGDCELILIDSFVPRLKAPVREGRWPGCLKLALWSVAIMKKTGMVVGIALGCLLSGQALACGI